MNISKNISKADRNAYAAALELSNAMAAYWKELLGKNLLGFYLLGSLAHGGFNRRYSDIDLGLVAEIPLTDAMLDTMRSHARSLTPELADKISLFWTDRSFAVGRFPPLDRLDFLDHSLALTEREAVRPDRPSLDDIRTYLQGAPFINWAKNTETFAALETLEPENHKPFLRSFLYAARFVYSWTTGTMASNDEAMALLQRDPPPRLDIELLVRAFRIRLDATDPDPLFEDRKSLPGLVEACAEMMQRWEAHKYAQRRIETSSRQRYLICGPVLEDFPDLVGIPAAAERTKHIKLGTGVASLGPVSIPALQSQSDVIGLADVHGNLHDLSDLMGGPDDDEDDGDGDGALPLRLVEAPDPNDGTGNYQYRPCQLMTTQQVARKLHMPVERLHRKDWRDALGAFQYGGPDMGKGCKVYWPREKVNAFLDAQKVDA